MTCRRTRPGFPVFTTFPVSRTLVQHLAGTTAGAMVSPAAVVAFAELFAGEEVNPDPNGEDDEHAQNRN